MFVKCPLILVLSGTLMMPLAVLGAGKNGSRSRKPDKETSELGPAVLWRDPHDIKSRNLFFGTGGEAHAPHTTYVFEKEDTDGTGPKFIVRDENGVRWKVKMGHEARPETVASRFVWAAGYSTNEDYFLPELHVEGMPERLHRGQQFINPPGTAHFVRMKRYLDGEKKVDIWKWGDNPFSSTREFNGLRVIMALLNNWDTKDINNAIYSVKHSAGSAGPERIYMVSDLGATFGTTGVTWRRSSADGSLKFYTDSKFVLKVTPEYVDFATPSCPLLLDIFDPPDFFMRVHMRWIGRRIPRSDVHWMGQLLAQLSPDQIRDAFRAAGYTSDEIEAFTKVVQRRIATLGEI
jgi:hypothetical protein